MVRGLFTHSKDTPPREAPRTRHPYRSWIVASTLLLVVGAGASTYIGASVANSNDQKIHHAFETSSAEITDTLKLYVHHQLDLITSVESFLLGDPHPTNAQFAAWTRAVKLLQHNKDLAELGIIDYVTAAQLPGYESAQAALHHRPFVVTPETKEPFYCFGVMGIVRSDIPKMPDNENLCAGPDGALITSARNSGVGDVLPYTTANGNRLVAFETPMYVNGTTPATEAERQRDFISLIALTVDPKTILASSLKNFPAMSVELRFGPTSSALFTSGAAATGDARATTSLGDGWSVTIVGRSRGGGVFGSYSALDIVFGGIALSLLMAALFFMLGTDRSRLRRLVDERTEQLHFQATHDSLTGLPNRALIVDRTEQLLARNRRRGTEGAALYIDLDDFKNVNDSLGHAAGDRLLVLVANRMTSALREVDTIGRVGGDEFVILLEGDNDLRPEVVAQRLLDAMRQPFELHGSLLPLIVNTSIGIAVGDRASGGDLLRDADLALYQAKAKGKNKYVFFDPAMEEVIDHRIALEFDLRSALADNQFLLHYQPIYAASDLTMVGVEALVRWQHPRLGLLGPDEFIPALERTGQIREVGALVLNEACRQVALWHQRGDRLNLAVNVSGRQFDEHTLIGQIKDALAESGLAGHALTVEVSETALMLDMKAIAGDLPAIKRLGVRISIDDFGTGYSSLASLRELPVDCLKIDQSLIASITTSEESMAVVRTFIQLGTDLGMKTLAEGVESFDQMDLLRASSVDYVQGFLFSHPLDPKELEASLLEPRRPASPRGPAPPPSHAD